jgi:MFS family permease
LGLGMTVAGGLGALASTPIGWLADRLGVGQTLMTLLLVQAAASCGYALVANMPVFVAVAAVAQIGASSTGGPRNALVLGLSAGPQRLEVLGLLRAISHVGWALGALAGGVVISIDTRPAYLVVLAINAASYVIYAVLIGSLRSPTALPSTPARKRITALGDLPYVSLAALMGVMALCWAMLSTGLPLWVTLHTHAPRAISAVIVIISSLGIAALQVPANRFLPTPRKAARGALLAGLALACSCLVFALSAGLGGWAAVTIMLLAAVLHICGELLFVAASWGLSVPLMPAHSPGEYQGVFATGEAAALMAAPALMTTLIAGWGVPGWIALAAIFLVPGVAVIPVTGWALRTRPVGG